MTRPSFSLAEAFAAIPLAAVCSDHTFATEEAELIRQQLISRAPYRTMEPYAFGLMVSGLLKQFRTEGWQGLIAAAAPVLSPDQRETAFALACQLVHSDRSVVAAEQQFLAALADHLAIAEWRARQIFAVCELLNRDCLAAGAASDSSGSEQQPIAAIPSP